METGSKNKKPLDKRLIVAAVLLFALGWMSGGGGGNPFAPSKPERPFLTALARLAKAGLWLLVVEPVPDDLPDEPEPSYAHADRTINHRGGW